MKQTANSDSVESPSGELVTASSPIRSLRTPFIVFVALGFIVFALWAIRRELASAPVSDIISDIKAVPALTVTYAIIAMCVSYFFVAIYDSLALRYTGKSVPLQKTMFASFSAYAISNSLGMSIFTGNAVRYRLYSKWGLSASDIAIVAIVSAVTLHAAAVFLAGIGLLFEGGLFETYFNLPQQVARIVGLVCILSVVALMAFVVTGPRKSLIKALIIRRPKLGLTMGQLLAGIADYGATALCLYILLPAGMELSFLAFVPIFVFAALVAGLSGLPGGVGVFEAIILLALPSGSASAVAASLLVYRGIYYLMPLMGAGLLLSGYQMFRARDQVKSQAARAEDILELTAPPLFTVLTFLTGLIILMSAATPGLMPRLQKLATVFPEVIIDLSHFAASIIGVVLLLTALGLRRRLRRAWGLACALLAAGVVLSVVKGGSHFETGLQAILLVMLFLSKDAFYRRDLLRNMRLTWPRFGALIGGVGLFVWIGFLTHRGQIYSDELWWNFAVDADASRFLRAFAGILVFLILYLIWRLIQPAPKPFNVETNQADMQKARDIIATAEGARADAGLALLGDKQFLFSDSGRSFIMFGVRGSNWVAMGEPVGLLSERREIIWKFRDAADIWNASPSFYAIGNDNLSGFVEQGFVIQKIGESAIVPLENYSLEGPEKAKFRQAKNKGIRNGLSFEIVAKENVEPILPRLREISDDWLAKHEGKEKGFSIGRFDERFIQEGPVAIIKLGEEILAFANLWATQEKHELSMDLMRYHSSGPNGTMDFLFTELMLWGSANGFKIFSLGMAPLSGLDSRRLAPLMSRLGAFIYENGDAFYNFEGLRSFKQKFNPVWAPVYMAALNTRTLPLALGNLALLNGGGVLGILQRSR